MSAPHARKVARQRPVVRPALRASLCSLPTAALTTAAPCEHRFRVGGQRKPMACKPMERKPMGRSIPGESVSRRASATPRGQIRGHRQALAVWPEPNHEAFGHGPDTTGSPDHHLSPIPIDGVDESPARLSAGPTLAVWTQASRRPVGASPWTPRRGRRAAGSCYEPAAPRSGTTHEGDLNEQSAQTARGRDRSHRPRPRLRRVWRRAAGVTAAAQNNPQERTDGHQGWHGVLPRAVGDPDPRPAARLLGPRHLLPRQPRLPQLGRLPGRRDRQDQGLHPRARPGHRCRASPTRTRPSGRSRSRTGRCGRTGSRSPARTSSTACRGPSRPT